MEFPIASSLIKKQTREKASMLYNADLIGAFLGSILVSVILIPLIGIIWVCVLVGGINAITLMVLLINK